ncbi:hypothetical protein [Pseudogemmobacter sonorensis]|uniref:hypothetical protein n=1 Tax=Pseudogemmobacter sonorensis TaxID=2989681 RepID=UPI003690A1BB
MPNGVTTDNLTSTALADGVLVNTPDGTAQQSFDALTRQVFASPLLSRLEARTMGVLPDSAVDNAAALNGALSFAINNRKILSASGTIRVGSSVTVRTSSGRGNAGDAGLPEAAHVEWARGTRIVVAADNTPGLILHGRGIRMTDVQVEYSSFQPASATRAIGVLFKDLSFSQLGFIDSRNAQTSFSQDWEGPDSDYFFDNDIQGLRAHRFSRRAVVLHPRNEGNTPNLIRSIYLVAPWVTGDDSWQTGTGDAGGGPVKLQQGIDRPVWINYCRGLRIDKLNIETVAATNCLLHIDNSWGVDIGVMHLEKVALAANYASVIKLTSGYANIGAMTLYRLDSGHTAGVTATTGIINTIDDGYLDLGFFELASDYWPGPDVLFSFGAGRGYRVGRFLDRTSPGAGLVDARGRPVTSSAVIPHITSFDGLNIAPAFWARGFGSTVIYDAGPLPVPLDHQTSTCYNGAGTFTAPVSGFYDIFARGRAPVGSDAIMVLRRNGSDTLRRWRHLRLSGATVYDRDNFEPVAVRFYLAEGDTVSFELEVGQLVMDNTVTFSAAFVSR